MIPGLEGHQPPGMCEFRLVLTRIALDDAQP
jgi:hypothetical protein